MPSMVKLSLSCPVAIARADSANPMRHPVPEEGVNKAPLSSLAFIMPATLAESGL